MAQGRKELPVAEPDQGQGCLEKFSAHTSPLDQMGYILVCWINKLMSLQGHSIIFQNIMEIRRGLQRLEKSIIIKKRQAGQPHFVPKKIMQQFLLKPLMGTQTERKKKKAIGNNEHEFTQDKKQPKQPHYLCDKMTGFMNGGQWMLFTLALARFLTLCLHQHPCIQAMMLESRYINY